MSLPIMGTVSDYASIPEGVMMGQTSNIQMEASDWLMENFHTFLGLTLRTKQITPSEQTSPTEPENCVKRLRTFLFKAACDFGLWKDVLAKPKVVSKPAKALSPK